MCRSLAILLASVVALVPLATTSLSQPTESGLIDTLGTIFFQGSRADAHLGNPAREAGDLNGDGFDDFAIAEHENGSTMRGSVYIYFGGPGLDNIPDLTLTGEGGSDRFGHGVAGAGDVNHDGYDDLIVGAIFSGGGKGRAYIFLGGPSMDAIPDLSLTGEGFDDFFGYEVSSAGDVNDDGFDDFMVSAILNDAGGGNAGRAYLYHGGSVLDGTPDWVFTGSAGHMLGTSVGPAGDVNADGYADVLVSTCLADADQGRVYLFFGGPGMDNTPDLVFHGQAPGDRFGYFRGISSTPGDINGDGYCDIVAPAPWSGPENMCRVYVFYGGPGLDNIADVIIPTGTGNPYEGCASVSIGGDINNDGFSDIVVGMQVSPEAGYWAGKAYVFLGGAVMDTIPDAEFLGREPGDFFGTSVAIVGDPNGDGYDDILVSAYEASQYPPAPGYARLYFMRANLSLHHFAISTITSPQIVGRSFAVTITAKDDANGTVTTFGGTVDLTTTAGTVSPPVSPRFVNGTWTGDVAVSMGGTGHTITATRTRGSESGSSNGFEVATPGTLHHYTLVPETVPVQAGVPFDLIVTARDILGDPVLLPADTVWLQTTAGTILPSMVAWTESAYVRVQAVVSGVGTQQTIGAYNNLGILKGTSDPFEVLPGPLYRFSIQEIPGPLIAGTPFVVILTALDSIGNLMTSFADSVDLTTTAGLITPSRWYSFIAGVESCEVVVTYADTQRTITATRSNGLESGTSNLFDVIPGLLDHFSFAQIADPETSWVPFMVTISARDAWENGVAFSGTVNLSTTAGDIEPPTSGPFIDGLWSDRVRVLDDGADRTITARRSDGPEEGTSAVFTVVPGSPPSALQNPGFESGKQGWNFSSNQTASFSADAPGYGGSLRKAHVVVASSENGTRTNLLQKNFWVQPSTMYSLTFRAYSSSAHDLAVTLESSATTPRVPYGLNGHVFDLTDMWDRHKVVFVTSGFGARTNDARLVFEIGPYDTTGDEYFLDDILLEPAVLSEPPSIVGQPESQVVMLGQSAFFRVAAIGTPPLVYQWAKDGVDIAGMTDSLCVLGTTVPEDSGALFTCRVSNHAGSVTSEAARLIVVSPAANTLVNGDFESGSQPWKFKFSGPGSFSIRSGICDAGAAALVVLDKKTSTCNVVQEDLSLDPASNYALSLVGRADGDRMVTLTILQQVSPNTNYGLKNWNVLFTSSCQRFDTTFLTTGFSTPVSDARLRIHLAAVAAHDSFVIDKVSLVKIPGLARIAPSTIPERWMLHQNYPNPFNPSTEFRFDLPEPATVSLLIYDILGRKVAELASGHYEEGYHVLVWDATGMASGVYLARFNVINQLGIVVYTKTNKLVLMK